MAANRSREEPWLWVLDISLHLNQKRLKDLASRRLQKIFGLLGILLIQRLASQKLCDFCSKHIAVMIDQVIFLHQVFMLNVLEELFEHLFWNLRLPDQLLLDRFAVWSLLWGTFTDASSEEVLAAVDQDWSVINCVNLMAYKYHAHVFCHSHRYVVH